MSKIFGGPWALRENQNTLNFLFFTNKPYFFKHNLNCTCSQLSFQVHNTLETQNFENFDFSTKMSSKIFHPLAAKVKGLKFFKVAIHVDFSAKKV